MYRAPTKKNGWRANSRHAQKIVTALAVRKHLLDAGHVCLVHQRQLLELAHAAGPFCAHQVALAGVPALDLAVGGKLEALPGAAVRFQFQFRFRCVPWHCWKSSRQFDCAVGYGGRGKPRPYKIMVALKKDGLKSAPTKSPPNPRDNLLVRSSALITATAGRWTTAGPLALRR